MRRIGIEGGRLIDVKFGMGPNLNMQGVDHFPGQRNRNASYQKGVYDFLQIDHRNHGVTDVVGDQRAARLIPQKRDDGCKTSRPFSLTRTSMTLIIVSFPNLAVSIICHF